MPKIQLQFSLTVPTAYYTRYHHKDKTQFPYHISPFQYVSTKKHLSKFSSFLDRLFFTVSFYDQELTTPSLLTDQSQATWEHLAMRKACFLKEKN